MSDEKYQLEISSFPSQIEVLIIVNTHIYKNNDFGIQADQVLFYRVLSVKSTWKCS